MSDHASHGHGHAPDHTPHVQPLKVYLATWGTLVFLTAITVAASYVNFGPANLIIAIVIATIKAGIVAALFMHLLHDHKFHALILVSGALFLLIFVSFTMFDTEYRGRADAVEGERPLDITRPFEGTTSLAAVQKKWGGGHAAAAAVSAMASASVAPGTSASAPEHHEAAPLAPSVTPSADVSAAPSTSVSAAPSASVAAPASASVAPSASHAH